MRQLIASLLLFCSLSAATYAQLDFNESSFPDDDATDAASPQGGPPAHQGVPPTVTLVNSNADTGDGELEECEQARVGVTELMIDFSEPVHDPPGDDDPGDVTNPANYLRAAAGPDNDFNTAVCG